jgi:hypothetical protein
MGLVLLSLLVACLSTSAWNGGDPAHRAGLSTPVWVLGAGDADLAGLPPQASSAREHHVLSLWPPMRGARHAAPAHLTLLLRPGSDADTTRDPQQLTHRTAGSRSPPAI